MKRWIDFSLGSIVYVKEQMGHSSIQVTVDTYGYLIQVRWLKAPGSYTTETSKVAPP
jgi:hypothetical protein